MYIIDISYIVVYAVEMVDTTYYIVEYRVHAASFYLASDQIRHAIKLVRDRLHVKYDIEAPEQCIIKAWSNKLLETGCLFDILRSGRSTERRCDRLRGERYQ